MQNMFICDPVGLLRHSSYYQLTSTAPVTHSSTSSEGWCSAQDMEGGAERHLKRGPNIFAIQYCTELSRAVSNDNLL